ncbi:MAG: hypothetical protein IT305_06895 [Chloroflexi bacterium]|nr:hypothetical protein [Chloroflexota bacterium]
MRADAGEEHERFVRWLHSDEAALQYQKYLLSGYALAQAGNDLTISLAADEPQPIVRFLRNPRMWPEFWEFVGAGPGDTEVPPGALRIRWRYGDGFVDPGPVDLPE